MKQGTKKFITWLLALVLFGGVLWVIDAFVGNPVSKMLATNTAKAHLAETYADTDYEIERVSYSFKDGQYHAFVKSPSSRDTEFTLYITKGGTLRLDTFERVSSRDNTAARLDEAYRALCDTLLESEAFPYTLHIAYDTLEFTRDALLKASSQTDIPSYALLQDELVLDGDYDIRDLGRKAGHLIIYVEGETVSVDEAAQVMCDIRHHFDDADIPFRAMDFVLWYPQDDDGLRKDGEVHVADFAYEEIRPDGMIERVTAADEALTAHYEKEDAKKAAEIKD